VICPVIILICLICRGHCFGLDKNCDCSGQTDTEEPAAVDHRCSAEGLGPGQRLTCACGDSLQQCADVTGVERHQDAGLNETENVGAQEKYSVNCIISLNVESVNTLCG
jgi:hypothetical protein